MTTTNETVVNAANLKVGDLFLHHFDSRIAFRHDIIGYSGRIALVCIRLEDGSYLDFSPRNRIHIVRN